jgi:Na+-translocating ferredoxin:NAD+ oxidoreductase RnfG subunit
VRAVARFRAAPHALRDLLTTALALAALACAPRAASAQAALTQEEALRLAFPPPATIERRTAFLEEDDLRRARAAAGEGVEVDQRVVTYYVGFRDGEPLGAAYFDVHRVRTLPEVLMVVVTPEGRISRIEVLKFSEPPEYRAPAGWIQQFHDRALTGDLSLKGAIRNMTGASLTSQAVTRAARRVLALHDVIRPFAEAATGSGAGASAASYQSAVGVTSDAGSGGDPAAGVATGATSAPSSTGIPGDGP